MGLSIIIFPDHSELEHTFGHLNNLERLLIFGIGLKEGAQAFDELVARLLVRYAVRKEAPERYYNDLHTCSNSGSEGRTIMYDWKCVTWGGNKGLGVGFYAYLDP